MSPATFWISFNGAAMLAALVLIWTQPRWPSGGSHAERDRYNDTMRRWRLSAALLVLAFVGLSVSRVAGIL